MTPVRQSMARLPILRVSITVGAMLGAVMGGLVGLVAGLLAHPATAWFAILEVGLPATLVGAMLGALIGSLTLARRRLLRR